MFKIIKKEGRARLGRFETVHGTIKTPVFMNVATCGAIKGAVSALDLKELKCQVQLCNTYHLHLRPGDHIVKKLGGLHRITRWDGPILTDSGGFQVFSLAKLRNIREEGVTFASHIDGRRIFHTVLDCFTHTGSFALNAASGGAARVTAADISADAIAMAQRNAERNGLTNMDFLCEDTFELLPRLEKEGHPYDFIILDPPAFTKARRTVENAMRGYKEINYRAMKLLPRGGYLATASCSHFATEELFIRMLRSAAKDAHRQLRQIEVRQQAPDHPILWGVPETNYLKFFLFQVI